MKMLVAAAVELDPENEETFGAYALVRHYIGHFTEVNGTASDLVMVCLELASEHPAEFFRKTRRFMDIAMRQNPQSMNNEGC